MAGDAILNAAELPEYANDASSNVAMVDTMVGPLVNV
jgi:hypothetical protein